MAAPCLHRTPGSAPHTETTKIIWEAFMSGSFRVLLLLIGLAGSGQALAEGRCAPGQYPIGGQGAGGCAPIPGGAANSGASSGPVAAGKWENRWGSVAEDRDPVPGTFTSTGVVVGQKSKRIAESVALQRCKRSGGRQCYIRISYYNQCAAVADFTSQTGAVGGKSTAASAGTVEEAKRLALGQCADLNSGGSCEVVYSDCSPSEFKSF